MADSRKNKATKAPTKPMTAKPKVSVAKSKTAPKAKIPTKPKVKGTTQVKKAQVAVKPKTKPKSKSSTKVKAPAKEKLLKTQSVKDLLSNQDQDVPDLNTSKGYPVHPNRIWPD